MNPLAITAAGNMAGTTLEMAANQYGANNQLQNQKEINRQAFELNQRALMMSPKANIAGAEQAGINPVTMAGNFSATAPTQSGGAASAATVGLSNIFAGLSEVVAAQKAPSEIKKTETETKTIQQQKELIKQQVLKTQTETQLNNQELDRILNINWEAVASFKEKYPDEWKAYVAAQEGDDEKSKEETAYQSATIGLMQGKEQFRGLLSSIAINKYQGMLAEDMNKPEYRDAVKKLTTEQAKILESQANTVKRQWEELDWLTKAGDFPNSIEGQTKIAEKEKLDAERKKVEAEAEKWADKLDNEIKKLKAETDKLGSAYAKDISDIINTSIGTGLRAVETILRAKGLKTLADKFGKRAAELEAKEKSQGKGKAKDTETEDSIDNAGSLGALRTHLNWANA